MPARKFHERGSGELRTDHFVVALLALQWGPFRLERRRSGRGRFWCLHWMQTLRLSTRLTRQMRWCPVVFGSCQGQARLTSYTFAWLVHLVIHNNDCGSWLDSPIIGLKLVRKIGNNDLSLLEATTKRPKEFWSCIWNFAASVAHVCRKIRWTIWPQIKLSNDCVILVVYAVLSQKMIACFLSGIFVLLIYLESFFFVRKMFTRTIFDDIFFP